MIDANLEGLSFDIKKICVIGLGYIGLPTSALLANAGFDVVGVDIKNDIVDIVNEGKIHIKEPDLDIFVKAAVKSGKLKASLKPEKADVFIISVPTPFKDNYVPNLDYVFDATKSIIPYLKEGNLVILESTSPVGTTEKIRDIIRESRQDLFVNEDSQSASLYIAHCPERVLPGRIMKELVENDRVIGGVDEKSTKVVSSFYKRFVLGKVLETDSKTAEMVKLVENSYRDVNIAFANELSILCDKFGINVWDVINLANHHPRVNILNPGIGVGGHCIAVDPWFIIYSAGEDAKIIKTAREVNNYKTRWVIEKIKEAVKNLKESSKSEKSDSEYKIALMGLTYKADVDDLRESPALHIAFTLLNEGFNIVVAEPNIKNHPTLKLEDYKRAIEIGDLIVFLVPHKEFRNLAERSKISNNKLILDFCGVFK